MQKDTNQKQAFLMSINKFREYANQNSLVLILLCMNNNFSIKTE